MKNWSVSVEHALSSRDVLSLGYAGAAGRNLLRREMGGPGSTERDYLALATNHGEERFSRAATGISAPAGARFAGSRRVFVGAFHR